MAPQIARTHLDFPAVIATTLRPKTTAFSKSMGATHTVNHRDPLPLQNAALNPSVPLKYIFIMHSPEQYLASCAEIAAPLAKVCSIVQAKKMQMYGMVFIAKSLCYVWELLGEAVLWR
jgi:NADPH:quinone reductase-like Zn-dependent oxidoreductase